MTSQILGLGRQGFDVSLNLGGVQKERGQQIFLEVQKVNK